MALLTAGYLHAADPGLPFTEDFANTNLKDEIKTNATWLHGEEEVYLAWRKVIYGTMSDPVTWDIGTDLYGTQDIAIGDVNGDGLLDVLTGIWGTNKLYLNNGTIAPFLTATAMDIGTDADNTQAIALGDMDGDGDLDVVAGNRFSNKLYLNNGTSNPFEGVTATQFGTVMYYTMAIALGDVDGDGDLDVVAGMGSNSPYDTAETNKLYLNNGTSSPFEGVNGTEIGSDTDETHTIVLGDVDGDGDLDVVVGNYYDQSNRLYLNNGTPAPFNGVVGTEIGSDMESTLAIALGDVDNDGDLDLVAGNWNTKKLYMNDGTSTPFNGITGSELESIAYGAYAIAINDVDGDGDLDVMAGNYYDRHELWLNNGTVTPFDGVTATMVGTDMDRTEALALGDMDGDGDLDVVAGNSAEVNKLYLNNSTLSPFDKAVGIEIGMETATDYTQTLAIGDVDGDGDLDVVTGNFYQQPNRLYLNNGTATPFNGVTGTEIGLDTDYTQAIALGDVDGDGDLDVVAGNASEVNKLYLNNGTTTPFNGVNGTEIGLDTNDTWAIALGDLDGDGDLDLVAGNSGYPWETNKLYLNNGTSTPFSGVTGTAIGADTDPTAAIALGDVDGDGDLDVVVGNGVGYYWENKLYLNNGTSTPFNGVSSTDIGVSIAGATKSIILGDMDGDGDLDVVTGDNICRLYLNNGTSAPFNGITAINIGTDAHFARGVAIGDVDSDGDLDVVAGHNGYINRVYLNNGTSSPFEGVIGNDLGTDADGTTHTIALGDMDGDGDLDAVSGNWAGQTNKLYINDRAATVFSGMSESQIGADSDSSQSMAVGDINGDGSLDVVAGNLGTNKLYLSNGNRTPFYEVTGTEISADANETHAVGIGDVNRDGNLDVVAGNNGQTNRLYLGNGNGTFWAGTDIGSDTDDTYDIELGDLNGDGRLDMIAGNYEGSTKVYFNDGDGDPFYPVLSSSIDMRATCDAALGDVDKDGDLDLVLGNHGTNRLYLNNGNGTFSAGTAIGSDTDNTRAIALGDVNKDGWLDVVAGNEYQTNKLYLNTGTGTFFETTTSGTAIGSEMDNTWSINLADIDRDGDLDVVAGNSDNTISNKVYWNDGVGTFSENTDIGPVDYYTKDIKMGDIDGDGFLDVVAGNSDNAANMLYTPRPLYDTGHGLVVSKEVDDEDINNISNATLTTTDILPINTHVDYFLSNNGGERFYQVYPGTEFVFPTQGNDLRWRAVFHSLSPALTARISEVEITTRSIPPQATAGGVLSYIEDDPPTAIDSTITVTDIDDVDLESATVTISTGYQNGEDVLGFTSANGITGLWTPGTGVLTLNGVSSVENYQSALRSVTYENIDIGNPTEAERTVSFVVNDGNNDSATVTSTVNVTRTNDPPQITSHDPDPANIVQSETIAISINTPPAPPSGHIYLTVDDPDNVTIDLSLIVQTGINYLNQENTITPVEGFFGELIVPLIVYDGNDYGDVYNLSVQVNDVTDPTVNLVEVHASGFAVDVTFSESMGTGASTPTNYIISGNGKGTLSNNPDSVVYFVGNTYRLTWTGGEMLNGGDITITTSDIYDAAGRLIGIPASGTDLGGGIGTSPVTTIVDDKYGGTYTSNVTVAFSCTDGSGSGCGSTYYSIDGTDPPTEEYTDPITITEDTVLKFYSKESPAHCLKVTSHTVILLQ
jgi:hypothetical protein